MRVSVDKPWQEDNLAEFFNIIRSECIAIESTDLDDPTGVDGNEAVIDER